VYLASKYHRKSTSPLPNCADVQAVEVVAPVDEWVQGVEEAETGFWVVDFVEVFVEVVDVYDVVWGRLVDGGPCVEVGEFEVGEVDG